MKTLVGTNLERVLAAGHFAVTAEVGPPRGPDPGVVKKKATILRGVADAYNVTDNQTAVVRMSSIAASKVLLQEGLEPIMQIVCRDRNRIAIQSDLLGAWALSKYPLRHQVDTGIIYRRAGEYQSPLGDGQFLAKGGKGAVFYEQLPVA